MTDADTIVRIASRGEGITADGRHRALAAPGDRLSPDGTLSFGPAHVTPPCRHFPECGGCQLQHVDDSAYANFVVDRVVQALHAQGLDAPSIDVPHLSPPRTRRRAALKAERHGKRVAIGFHERASNRIVDLHECHILQPELFALIAPLRRLLVGLLSDRSRASVVMTRIDQGIDLTLGGVTVDGLDAVEALTGFAQAHGLARVSIDEGYGASARFAPDNVTVTLGGVSVEFPEGAFLQATADGELALQRAVRRALDGCPTVADLFAGLGTFALALPGRVTAVEGARDVVLALAATRRVEAIHRDLFRQPLTEPELGTFDGVVLDPPRAGASAQVMTLARSTVSRVAYVSCNPATFARDARMLIEGGFRLERVTPVGQFRWSTHVELAAAFRREKRTGP